MRRSFAAVRIGGYCALVCREGTVTFSCARVRPKAAEDCRTPRRSASPQALDKILTDTSPFRCSQSFVILAQPSDVIAPATSTPSFREALRFWFKLGWISFGGPTGQIAILHEEVVERRKWVSEERFLHALNFCMLLPGPEATQLATYLGWLMHRT